MKVVRKLNGQESARAPLCFALCAMFFTFGFPSMRSSKRKLPKIGWLAAPSRVRGFRHRVRSSESLSKLGYVEGKNIVFEYRYAEGNVDRLPTLAERAGPS